MSPKNLYYAQLGEALRLAQNNIFEYKRLSLILLDNIMENLLFSKISVELNKSRFFDRIDNREFRRIIKDIENFKEMLKQLHKLEIINESQMNIIGYCHMTRNSLYHNLFANKNITEFCIIFYCNFLENNFNNFIESCFSWQSESEMQSQCEIIKVEDVRTLDDIMVKLKEFNRIPRVAPQSILADVIIEYIQAIESSIEGGDFDGIKMLNNNVEKLYKDYLLDKKNYFLNPNGYNNNWRAISRNVIDKTNRQTSIIRKQDVQEAFKNYREILIEIEPTYIGLMLYYRYLEDNTFLLDD